MKSGSARSGPSWPKITVDCGASNGITVTPAAPAIVTGASGAGGSAGRAPSSASTIAPAASGPMAPTTPTMAPPRVSSRACAARRSSAVSAATVSSAPSRGRP